MILSNVIDPSEGIKKFTPLTRLSATTSSSNPDLKVYTLSIGLPLPKGYQIQKNANGELNVAQRVVQNDCLIVINLEKTKDYKDENDEVVDAEFCKIKIEPNVNFESQDAKIVVICTFDDPQEGAATSAKFKDADIED